MDVLLQTVPRHNAPPPHYWVTLREEFRKGLHPQFRRGRATCNNTRFILNHNQPGLVNYSKNNSRFQQNSLMDGLSDASKKKILKI